jgi:UDP-3-O-[3-hydroxymyristoyl] glucosamine N-acyltransferase
MSSSHRLGDLARRVGGRVRGDAGRAIRGIATLEDAGPDDLSFLTHPRYRDAARRTRAGAVLVAPGRDVAGRDLLEVAEPQLALARLLELFHPPPAPRPGVSPDARVAAGAELGRDVEIGPFAVIDEAAVLADRVAVGAGCFVGRGVMVGEDTRLMPRVVLYPGTRVGRRCLIHSGVVLGGDGFGFATADGTHAKVPQVGRVVVEDDVEIGANSAVDRAMLGETRIGRGTKIDDLVMVAHGVRLGPGCLLAAQSGIAGSTRIGAGARLAGQSGVAGHLELGDGLTVAAKSAVLEDAPAGAFVSGIPAIDHRRWRRAQAVMRRLPELQREVRDLRARVAELQRRADREGEG